ncbi:MAG: hypothetical protein O9308_06635 [Beijerinckiaceae bacterium]|nr:hypothetical protein [Beijerinckiaceae bacterium]
MPALPEDHDSKELWRRQRAKIRQILMDYWDPIGIRGLQGPEDEYDRYVGEIAAALRNNMPISKIEEFLRGVVTEHMGLSVDPANYSDLMPRLAALRLGD